MIRVGVIGALGRMGSAVRKAVTEADGMMVSVGVEAPGHPELDQERANAEPRNTKGFKSTKGASRNAAPAGIRLESDISAVLDQVDVFADFSVPEGLEQRVEHVAGAGKAYVCGVTGLARKQLESMQQAGARIPVVYAPNFSVGVSVLCQLVAQAGRLLGPEYDVEVIETHHRKKRDAPSGTAKRIVEVLQQTRQGRPVHGREGESGPKPVGEIGVHSVRTGDVVGEHTVIFGTPGERLELAHRASGREAFSRGVVLAVRFAHQGRPGFYSIEDVLGKPAGPG